ncbi:MAG: MBL fold metallo-hydrolase [Syntrophobacterales bacterium]|nr:MAG: MBL fold metallo-hydrolase [Syntrophobacterales bacterium]
MEDTGKEGAMRAKYYGHAAFLITSNQGTRIITDPYTPGAFDAMSYGGISDKADVVTVSHDHDDHNYSEGLPGNPEVLQTPGKRSVYGIEFNGIATFHDTSSGRERGENIIFSFIVDGITICHLGDLGHVLSGNEVEAIGAVDLLMIPVGGFYTIDSKVASEVAGQLNPLIIIPMHFKTGKCEFPITPVEEFTKGKARVKVVDSSEISLGRGELSKETEIIVLHHAL